MVFPKAMVRAWLNVFAATQVLQVRVCDCEVGREHGRGDLRQAIGRLIIYNYASVSNVVMLLADLKRQHGAYRGLYAT
jgi:hypothetical protein